MVFGGLWLIVEPGGLFFLNAGIGGWKPYLVLHGLAAAVTFLFFRPPTAARVTLSGSDASVTVKVSDLLTQVGSVAIGTNDTFDTQLGRVISATSVQGQFLTRVYDGDQERLDTDIEAALDGVGFSHTPGKSFGKQQRYPMGSTAVIRHGETTYFLVAYSHLDPAMVATTDLADLATSFDALWAAIHQHGNYRPVHVPVLGSSFARTGLSHEALILLIATSFSVAAKTRKPGPSLTIHVHSSDSDKVDFVKVRSALEMMGARQAS
jgi:hypothetical protein